MDDTAALLPRKRARDTSCDAEPPNSDVGTTVTQPNGSSARPIQFLLQQRRADGTAIGEPLALPAFGLGTFRSKGASCRKSVEHAVRHGCRHVDTAASYNNEAEVAAGIAAAQLDSNEHVVVTTKVARGLMGKSAADIKSAVLASCAALKRDKLDILLLHWPGTDNSNTASPLHRRARIGAWRVLEELREAGVAKIIGVSNFTVSHLELLLQDGASVVPAVNQVECHPYLPQTALRAFCVGKQIHVQGYCTLGRCDEPPRCLYGNYEPSHPRLVNDPHVITMAKELKITPPQLLLLWSLERGLSVVPKCQQPAHFDENAVIGLQQRRTGQESIVALPAAGVKSLDGLEKPAGEAFAYAYPLTKVPV